jgi:hypothetical protein
MTDARLFTVTQHALKRSVEMGLEAAEIKDAFARPEEIWHSPKYGCQMRHRGRVTLSISMEDPTPVIVTVLWSTPELWAASYQNGGAEGRDERTPDEMAHLTRRKGT